MSHSDFDVVTGPSMPQLRTPAPQPQSRSPETAEKPSVPAAAPRQEDQRAKVSRR
jgi:hypothetical protein